jgi:hypothetical protein
LPNCLSNSFWPISPIVIAARVGARNGAANPIMVWAA